MKKLHEAGVDSSNLELTVENDAEMQLKDAAIKYKLAKGARALAVNLGTGFNLKDRIDHKGSGVFSEIKFKSRIPMPEMDKYKDLEGQQRAFSSSDSIGSASVYITGGHDDNSQHGPRGTLNHLFKLLESEEKEDKRTLQRALKLLIPNRGIKARLLAIVGLGNRARRKTLEKNILKTDFDKTKELTNQAIEAAAKDGDKLALELLKFVAKRTAQVLKAHIEESPKNLDVIYLAGGFANGIYDSDNKHLKGVRDVLETELKKYTKAKLKLHNPEFDGAIEYLN